ncbi:alpha/beta hydrolase [Pseudohaliea sp.]|uniref:alpha/beta fold hydrolase n=1 Tax=Pseudohaliea sp. TaxID=2740289 RepID=UPI0032EF5D1F
MKPLRAFATLDSDAGPWQVHYRVAGAGAPVVLLHPSPLSSAFLAPATAVVARRARALAPDTPGYGDSDPLPPALAPGEGLAPYVAALLAFVDALALERPLIYGSATGAQLAIEFARAHPGRCAGLVLENVALFEDAEREALLAGYFPDLAPRPDGSHLAAAWDLAVRSGLRFPWTAAPAGTAAADPAATQASVLATLRAGPAYDRAYRAAFANERPERLQGLAVPTRIIRWPDGPLAAWSDRLDDVALPPCVTMVHAGAGVQARYAALGDTVDALLAETER